MFLHHIKESDLPRLRNDLVDRGCQVYELNCADVYDPQSFFAVATDSLPMGDASNNSDIDWRTPKDWNAFSDFLWQGLTENRQGSALLLFGVAKFMHIAPQVFEDAIECFSNVVDAIANETMAINSPLLQVYLVDTFPMNQGDTLRFEASV